MMQGDSYGRLITIRNANDVVITEADVEDVEITIGFLKKKYSTGEVLYRKDVERWVFPMEQGETFRFPAMRVKGQVRVKFKNGDTEGASLGFVNVFESASKEVL